MMRHQAMEPRVIAGCAALGFGAGWATVHLVLARRVPRLVEVLPASVLVIAAPIAGRGEPAPAAAALLVSGVGGVVGWVAASSATLTTRDRTPGRVARPAPGAPHRPAVVYFTHGEPETYEPEPWIDMLHELRATVPGFPPKPVWPFVLDGIKHSFARVGSSPHGRIHGQIMAAVQDSVARSDVSWYQGFLDAEPRLADALALACREGATEVVLLTVFLTDSDHTEQADAHVAALGLADAGIPVVRTPVLWDDPRLARMVADKVIRAVADRDRASVGVVLVGHGQPPTWDADHPTETQQEQAFRTSITEYLLAQGFSRGLVSDAWMSFREPTVPARVRMLADQGATTVVGVPVTISADSLHSLWDTPSLIRRGARRTGVEVIDVGAWNKEPLLVELLAERAADALAECDRRDRRPGADRELPV